MTFELWGAFQNEWRLRPPVHWLAAAFMGYRPPSSRDDRLPVKKTAGRSLADDFPGGFAR